jgi:hypothetical protein
VNGRSGIRTRNSPKKDKRAQERGRALANTLGAHLTVAELALAMGDLVGAGTAFLDAGFPELAVKPFQDFVDARPAGASIASEYLRLEQVGPLFAFARKQTVDAEAEIARSLAASSPAAYIHAERVARLAGLGSRRAEVIAAARAAFPGDPQPSRVRRQPQSAVRS